MHVVLKLGCAPVLCAALLAAAPSAHIHVDQVGYLPGAPKIAVVAAQEPAKAFTVVDTASGKVVVQGELSAPMEDASTGDRVQTADFSRLTKPGRYHLEVAGVGQSWPFAIGDGVYTRAFYLAMRSFYGQRCGTKVDLGPEFPGYSYEACHLNGAYHASSGKTGPQTPVKGWHDAGDYGRYIVNSGISTGTLLWAWELFGSKLKSRKLDIPESGNTVPDMLDEIRWNLEWMLSMQDADGGVWHKQTSERFCGFVLPHKDTLTSYVIGTGSAPFKSSCATADFAAVMAIAARVYRTFDASFAARCLKAAQDAWAWLDQYPDVLFTNPAGVSTGAYGDRDCQDERLWAAAELSRSTRDDRYERYFLDNYARHLTSIRPVGPPSWPNVGALGLWTYVLGKGGNKEAVAAIRKESLAAANLIAERTERSAYRNSMTTKDYVWGSNGVAANYGLQLVVARAMDKQPRFLHAALDNLHYLLGRNTFSLSWVTQVGANPYRHPHHRPSGADQNAEPWPGLLSGGPNGRPQDPAMKKLGQLPPAKMYLDEEASYASNEIAINWNAPLVFLLAATLP